MNTCGILLASDNADKRRDLRAGLELKGHRVTEAATAAQTVQTACAEMLDVLVMDSVVDGIAAYQLCRTIRPKSDLGIIVLAGEDTKQSRIDALNAGADDFLPAPFILA